MTEMPRPATASLAEIFVLSAHLFKRTVGARYRRSYLGYFWMIAPPLFVSGVATLAVRAGALSSTSSGLPQFLFTTIGVVVWMTFSDTFETPYAAIEEARPYLTRINFPREIVVLAKLYETGVTIGVRLALLYALLFLFHRASPVSLAGVTGALFCALALGMGAGALIAPFSVLFSDLHDFTRLAIGYGMFASPALYAPRSGIFAMVVNANPLAAPMVLARETAAAAPLDDLPAFLAVLAVGLALVVVGMCVFRLSSTIIVERMLLGGR